MGLSCYDKWQAVVFAVALAVGVSLHAKQHRRKRRVWSNTTEVSAPGKVLITGGYLVLEKPNTGLVLTVSARFYSRISCISSTLKCKYEKMYSKHRQRQRQHTSSSSSSSRLRSSRRHSIIVVHSPQISSEPTVYSLELDDSFTITNLSQTKPNPFIENSIRYALMSISDLSPDWKECLEILQGGLTIHLRGDRHFYGGQSEDERKGQPEPEDISSISKTGLGSSAALVSSLVGALFAHFGLIFEMEAITCSHHYTSDVEQAELRHVAHNVAQVSHCAAQGKVGSGFDVAAAFFGSQQYERFDPKLIRRVLHPNGAVTASAFSECVGKPENFDGNDDMKHNSHLWDYEINHFELPPRVHLVLGDVSGGSETPGMVRKVLQWKQQKPSEAIHLWNRISHLNCRVATQFRKLNSIAAGDEENYTREIERCAESPPGMWPSNNKSSVGSILSSIRKTFEDLRQLLREMGEKSGVPIEPFEQTELLDCTLEERGVLCAGVPGAGGYDAVFVLALSRSAVQSVEKFWATFPRRYVRKLDVVAQPDGIKIQ